MAEFAGFNTVPPHETQEVETTEAEDKGQATTEETTAVEDNGEQTTETPETTESTETTPDEFIENFNKRYNTEYKADDDIKSLFSLPGKVKEYEDKLKDHDSLKTSAEQYKKELEELKESDQSDLLNKPRIRKAFIAEQLIAKYPDRDPDILGELAMVDIEKMSDIDVLARERKMRGSKSSLENIKAVIIKELGVDAEQPVSEWDDLVKTELELKATDARDRIKTLLKDIEVPKVVTKEEREAQQAKFLEEKVKAVGPIKEVFKKFDTYKNGEFEFTVSDEFKSSLGDIFDNMFIKGGLEVNEENLATAELLKKALFVEEYLPKMLEVKEKEVLARVKAEQDALLNNDEPPNTATATDQNVEQEDPNRPGLSKFFQSR
jgi:hypothetical protein